MTHVGILVDTIEFGSQNDISSLQDIIDFHKHNNNKNNNSNVLSDGNNNQSIQKDNPSKQPRKKKQRVDILESISLTHIIISAVSHTPTQEKSIKIPVHFSALESDDHLTIQSNGNWDSTKFCKLHLNDSRSTIDSHLITILHAKGQENLFKSLLQSNNEIKPTERRILLNRINKLKRETKDWKLDNLQLCIDESNLTWSLEFDLVLLFKENSYNKFSLPCNQILDYLYGQPSKNATTPTSKIETNNNFIQKHFFKQTIKYTKDILSHIDINFYKNDITEKRIPNLNVDLLPFQDRSVQWMLNKELHSNTITISSDEISPIELTKFLNEKICYGYVLLQKDNSTILYWNKFTNFLFNHEHGLLVYNDFLNDKSNLSGAKGLLSDEMGLGKTIEILALMLLNKRNLPTSSTFVTQDNKTIHRSNGSLIICPNPLLKQWINEIEMHTDTCSIKFFHYQGYNDIIKRFGTSKIEEIINKLLEYDLIITTYQVINVELHYAQYNANLRSRRRRNNDEATTPRYDYSSPLSLIQFWRIILDEVQMLKSDNTQIAKCTNLLHRIHTWGVSGTPIQTIRDFQTVLSYLQIYPFVKQKDIVLNIHNDVKSTVTKNGIKFNLNDLMNIFLKFNICIRHIKKDVISQIHLPKQTNYILPLEFNPIEWDNYLHLWNEFIAASGYGTDGQNETRLSNTVLNQWLLKLRYICCHAIIPENIASMLNIGTYRGRGKGRKLGNGSSNSGEIHNDGDLVRNIDDVLVLMTNDAIDNLDFLNRENIQLKIRSSQAYMELQEKPQKGIDLLKITTEKIRCDLQRLFGIIDEFNLDIDDKNNSDKLKIRSYLDLLHQCYFFLGTGYYFLGSKKLEKVEEENEKIKLIHATKTDDDVKKEPIILKTFTDFYSEDEMLNIEKMQLQEKDYYERAEKLRKEILLERAQKVGEVIEDVKKMFKIEPESSETTKPKNQNKMFTELKIISFDSDDYSSNQLVSTCYKSLVSVISLLNKQGQQFNELLKLLTEYLYKPVAKEYDETNENEKAEEYNTSLEDQDRVFGILHCLEELLKNREIVVSSEDESIKLNKKQFVQIDPTYSEFHSELLHNLVLIDKGASLKSVFNDLKNAKIVRSSTNKKDDIESFEDYLLQYNKEIPRILKEIKGIKESIKTLNLIYNAKVEYYGQLQKISDSLVSLIQLEPLVKNNILKSIRNDKRFNENLIKISKVESRIKYLQNLAKVKELIESEKSFTCAICLGIIHDGSIIKCGHFFCHDCIHNWLNNKRTCPICKIDTNMAELYNFKFKNKEQEKITIIEPKPNLEIVKEKIDNENVFPTTPKPDDDLLFKGKYERFPEMDEVSKINIKEHFGAKIDFMVQLILYLKLKAATENHPSPQILIYSQNFEFLKIITKILKINHILHLTCLSNVKSVSNTIDKFKKNSDITCLLLNVKSLGAGLNLLNAQHIFLLDPIISHNDELQAMSRNYRIGQIKETFIWNFMIRDSVEENIFRYKSILENNKKLSTSKKFKEREDSEEADTIVDDEALEISDNSTELVSNEHLWHCFFRG
ncbi:hypothetical protein C6P44_005359 [Monosporozyma unispora]|nr:hypothetical protein C6P44_005359 [Kazachstania unispora]